MIKPQQHSDETIAAVIAQKIEIIIYVIIDLSLLVITKGNNSIQGYVA